jgi:branched-chain amino acid transport system permease protein
MYAIALIIEGALDMIFSATLKTLPASYVDTSFPILGFRLGYIYLYIFALSIILLVLLYLLVYRTKFGYSLRASVQNPDAASLIGIEVEKVQALTFGIGTALAAAGGLAYGATISFNPASSYDLIVRLLVIIVLGGMGSLRGAFVAAMAMTIISSVIAVTWAPVWSSTVFNILLVLLLLFRPQGLFGQLEGRKQ